MPVLLVDGVARAWSECCRRERSLHLEVAVQTMGPHDIRRLARSRGSGGVCPSVLCLSVTDVCDEQGRATVFAAVSPHSTVCSADEVILVPLAPLTLTLALGAALRSAPGSPEQAALRSVIAARRDALETRPVPLSGLDLRSPHGIACALTGQGILAVIVPRTRARACAHPPKRSSVCFDSLHLDLQLLVASVCAWAPGNHHVNDLRKVSKVFKDAVDRAVLALQQAMGEARRANDAATMLRVGHEAALRGLDPLHVASSDAPAYVRVA